MRLRRGRIVLVAAAALVLAVVGYAVFQYVSLSSGITKSTALGTPSTAVTAQPDTNILIMGLDSRVDENGNPLPKAIYDALHAGTQSDGGHNANVLMLLHIPGDGSRATEISIPRDDYVDLPGCPYGQCRGKIKQAYGLAYAQEAGRIANDASLDKTQREQKARDAGRKAEVDTVKAFLGGVPIDHFVEVTMVAFYQLAQVVQPITVCVNEATQDSYSGANFRAGQQQIDAAQAVAFVRQRRDDLHPSLNFTDIDRERRQQAFIASLATQLKQAGTLANPAKLSKILDVVKQNTAIDSGLDLLSFAQQAGQMAGGNVTYYTLPVERFGKNSRGEDVNYVNLDQIRVTVKQLLSGQASATPSAPTTGPAGNGTLAPSPTTGTPGLGASGPAVPVPVTGTEAPPPTALSALSGGGIPCVK